jgi:hypothetical protein
MTKDSSLTSVPNANIRLGYWRTLRLSRWARRDAKKYQNHLDGTATHAIRMIEQDARNGQNQVNQWLANALQPFREGNVRIDREIEQFHFEIKEILRTPSETGRKRKEAAKHVESLNTQLLNAIVQRNINLQGALTRIQLAEEARQTWIEKYAKEATHYLRIKAARLGQVPNAAAKYPIFNEADLLDVSDITRDTFLDEATSVEIKVQ